MEDSVRWSLKVSKKTDLALRTYLGAQGMKKGDLSRFIEDAIQDKLFHRTVMDIKRRNASTDQQALQREIDQAAREVRRDARTMQDTEDLAAFRDRAKEPTVAFEALVRDLKQRDK